jgi:hypothetical protein
VFATLIHSSGDLGIPYVSQTSRKPVLEAVSRRLPLRWQ